MWLPPLADCKRQTRAHLGDIACQQTARGVVQSLIAGRLLLVYGLPAYMHSCLYDFGVIPAIIGGFRRDCLVIS